MKAKLLEAEATVSRLQGDLDQLLHHRVCARTHTPTSILCPLS